MPLIQVDEQAWYKLSETQLQLILGECIQFMQQIKLSGQYLSGNRLHPTSTVTRFRFSRRQTAVEKKA